MNAAAAERHFDVVVVGAGHSGLYLVYKLRSMGLSVIALEAEDAIGGTWYRNRYPGLRCDVESVLYSYSFDPDLDREWRWTERFPTQPEILSYLNHVADRFDLHRDIRLNSKVGSAAWDEDTVRWTIETTDGARFSGRFCIMATGILSVPSLPNEQLLGDFKGEWYHTANWPKEPVDFTGKRVGIVGTGSSGVQAIPPIAAQAEHLTVFQRTPALAIPAQNYALDDTYHEWWCANFPKLRDMNRWAKIVGFGDLQMNDADRIPPVASALDATPDERHARYQKFWDQGGGQITVAYPDLILNLDANRTLSDFTNEKIDEIVNDPITANALKPNGFPLGTKRPCLEIGYYEAFNRDNVTLANVREDPINRTTATGIALESGRVIELDALVFATGYDAVTGALVRMDVRGRDGQKLADKWVDGPAAYLGLTTAGFPNFFMMLGPTSPSAFTNCLTAIEQHGEWVTALIDHMREHGLREVESTVAADEAWSQHAADLAAMTLFPLANSWYMGDNIPGKPRRMLAYVGGLPAYRTRCDEIAANGYDGFVFDRQTSGAVSGSLEPVAGA